MNRKQAIAYMAERYGWDPARVDKAILAHADYFGRTREVYYPDAVVVVRVARRGVYEVAEIPLQRVALTPASRYTSRVRAARDAITNGTAKEASTMATVTRGRAKAKPVKAVEPEPDEDEELGEDEEEELEDEAEVDEDEEPEEDEAEDEEESDEEDESDEDPEDDIKDYTPYAGKAPTPTMADFADWIIAEVFEDEYPGDEEAFRDGVRLGGTLRMEFQASDFNKERRAERRAATKAPAKPAKPTKAAPAKAKPVAKAAPTKAAQTTKPATRTIPGKPAPRTADRPAKPTTPARRGGRSTSKEAPY